MPRLIVSCLRSVESQKGSICDSLHLQLACSRTLPLTGAACEDSLVVCMVATVATHAWIRENYCTFWAAVSLYQQRLCFWQQRRQGKWIMNFMVASVLTSWYFSWNHCSGYFTTWMGVFPLEVVVTGAMVRAPLPPENPNVCDHY